MSLWLLCGAWGCSRGGGGALEEGADLAAAVDLAAAEDLGGADLAARADLTGAADLAGGRDLATAPDLASPDLAFSGTADVIIVADNTCKLTVTPPSFTVPKGQQLKLTYWNRSATIPVDVWMSYNGGFTDLAAGSRWAEPIPHCGRVNPYTAWADVSACGGTSKLRMLINCL